MFQRLTGGSNREAIPTTNDLDLASKFSCIGFIGPPQNRLRMLASRSFLVPLRVRMGYGEDSRRYNISWLIPWRASSLETRHVFMRVIVACWDYEE